MIDILVAILIGLVLGAATLIGLLASRLKTSMTHCMSSLILPVLRYYFI